VKVASLSEEPDPPGDNSDQAVIRITRSPLVPGMRQGRRMLHGRPALLLPPEHCATINVASAREGGHPMPWNVILGVTKASDGSPASGIPVMEATPQGAQLAVTDPSGTADVTFEVDASGNNALYIATIRFSIEQTAQRATVTVYDPDIYARLMAHLPPFTDDQPVWRVQYTITDAAQGSPISGISAIDPLTGATLASNPVIELRGEGGVVYATVRDKLWPGSIFEYELGS
jgi:hypothetical protein